MFSYIETLNLKLCMLGALYVVGIEIGTIILVGMLRGGVGNLTTG